MKKTILALMLLFVMASTVVYAADSTAPAVSGTPAVTVDKDKKDAEMKKEKKEKDKKEKKKKTKKEKVS